MIKVGVLNTHTRIHIAEHSIWQLCHSLGLAYVKHMPHFLAPSYPPHLQATVTCDLHCCRVSDLHFNIALPSSKQVWRERPAQLLQLMISIIGSATEQVNELGVSFQLNLHLNKQANLVYAPSLIYTTRQFIHSSYRQCIVVTLMCCK